MKLLIVTQKVDINDPVLGFFHRWIEEFSKHCEQVTVIALGVGEYHLPNNVRVFSLGKESGLSRLKFILNFFRLIYRERKNYDTVFVHMNPIYMVLAGLFWRLLGKGVALWYTHKHVDLKLRIAEKLSHIIFTASRESFCLRSNKVKTVGHGIFIEKSIHPSSHRERRDGQALLCVGRLTPIKDQETIIRACGTLLRQGVSISCTFIGDVATTIDKSYNERLHRLVLSERVEEKTFFKGNLTQKKVFPYYWQSGVHINACPTGGLDKVVIEAMAGGAIPIVANESFRDIFGEYADRLIFHHGHVGSLAKCIKDILESDDKEIIRATLEKKARELFDLSIFVKNIVNWYEAGQ